MRKWPALGRAGSSISVFRLLMVREGSHPYSPNPVRNSSDPARIFRSYLAGADREYFVALLLDAKHRRETLLPAEDIVLTRRLVKAGELLGIKVLDHIIIGEGQYTSFADRGLILSDREER